MAKEQKTEKQAEPTEQATKYAIVQATDQKHADCQDDPLEFLLPS